MPFVLDPKFVHIILLLSIATILYYGFNRYSALRRNIKLAQDINLPYVLLPFYTSTLPWLILGPLLIPLLRVCLPSYANRGWIDYMLAFWTWYLGYEPFEKLGSDTILTVAPGGITFWTCSPEVIAQIGARGRDFPKPVEYYKVLNIFGPNVLSSTGPNWRRQRKSITAAFNEPNNALVWDESVHQTSSMIRSWVFESGKATINFQEDFKMLAFHVLSRGGFGVRLPWIGREQKHLMDAAKSMTMTTSGKTNTMHFGEAMLCVVENMKEIFVLPNCVLKYAPLKSLNKSWLAHKEVTRHMNESMATKRSLYEEITAENKKETDILSSLLEHSIQQPPGSRYSESPLSDGEIIANVFATMIAGHETSGSTLFHVLIMLALHPSWQRQMQAEIDEVFMGRDPATWSYQKDGEKLFGSIMDAVLCETLRLLPPANLIPKRTAEGLTQVIKYKDREIHVPGDTRINILVASTHRNPNYYPTNPHPSGVGTDINDFRPSRWQVPNESSNHETTTTTVTYNVLSQSKYTSSTTTTYTFLRPQKGAFVPFSIGQRECIGKRFARIEMLVVLAVIFRDWSIELIVDGEKNMSIDTRWTAWQNQRDKVRRHLKEDMEHYMTMQLGKGLCPMRIVKRGAELYGGLA